MPWIIGKVALPETTGTHTVQVPQEAMIMVARGTTSIDVVYTVPEGTDPQDMRFDVLKEGETLPDYDKAKQRYIGTVDLNDVLYMVFERIDEPA